MDIHVYPWEDGMPSWTEDLISTLRIYLLTETRSG
jgi:hypothetical protein